MQIKRLPLERALPRSVFTDDYKRFLALLVQARRDAGLTQSELAERLDVDQSWISKVERGVRRIDVIETISLLKACDSSLIDVLQHKYSHD